jgi:hypothetical protein
MFDLIVSHRLALHMHLRRFASELGLSESMASATAQAFLQKDSGITHWDAWLRWNCSGCVHSIEACPMFKPAEIPGGLTLGQHLSGQIHLVESGTISECPQKMDPSDH